MEPKVYKNFGLRTFVLLFINGDKQSTRRKIFFIIFLILVLTLATATYFLGFFPLLAAITAIFFLPMFFTAFIEYIHYTITLGVGSFEYTHGFIRDKDGSAYSNIGRPQLERKFRHFISGTAKIIITLKEIEEEKKGPPKIILLYLPNKKAEEIHGKILQDSAIEYKKGG